MTRLKILTCTFLGDCVQWNQIWLKSRMQAITCCKILSRKSFIMMERMCSLNPWQAWDDLTRTFTSALSSPCHPKVKAWWQPWSILFKLWRKKLVSFHCPWRMWIHTSYLRPVKWHICAHCEESPKMKISFWLRYEKLHLDLMVWVNISSCHLFAENSILITDLWENNKLTFFTTNLSF